MAKSPRRRASASADSAANGSDPARSWQMVWALIKRDPRKYAYSPDKQERATETVPEQAALLTAEWATG